MPHRLFMVSWRTCTDSMLRESPAHREKLIKSRLCPSQLITGREEWQTKRATPDRSVCYEMNKEQDPPPYNPYYPPPYPNAPQGNAGPYPSGMMPPIGFIPSASDPVNVGIPEDAPPEYSLSIENENCFSDVAIRRGFIRKVYLTLMVQLLITVGIICAFLYWETLKDWVEDTYWFTYTMMGVTFALIIVLVCCGDLRRKVPLNFIFLGLFTVAEGCLLGSVVVHYSAEAVLWAVGATALVSLAMSLFSLQSKVSAVRFHFKAFFFANFTVVCKCFAPM
ncbi:hypothetical protein DNTS_001295 [Danionella cerebrum]|uniref:Protein lifeguard 1 n=1 Tax=Danionella cerebrum TaxID=2873325 RepID=A0A553Q3P5_9TELE|nr:hypothetical protein DNTS_001295 [Danionella translucida]